MNLVHPRPTTWEAVLTGRAAALRDRLPLKPITEWVAELERLSANATVQTLNTIVRLQLEAEKDSMLTSSDTTACVEASPVLQESRSAAYGAETEWTDDRDVRYSAAPGVEPDHEHSRASVRRPQSRVDEVLGVEEIYRVGR